MNLIYKAAGLQDLKLLTDTRIKVLIAANKLHEGTDMSEVRRQTEPYYRKALVDGSHYALLVFDRDSTDEYGRPEGRFAAAGGISFFQVMPTYCNPSGWKAYIMNMYTDPEYRRRGVAAETLDILVKEAKNRGIGNITLEATDMGRPLYEKYGFVPMKDEMILKKI